MASHLANATGTLEVLLAARRARVPHVIVASSSSVYGANPELPKHEAMKVAPMSPYAVSKLAAESYALAFGHCYGLATLAFRFFNVFGPLQAAGHAYAAVIPAFLDAAMNGRPLPVQGDGTQSRDFTYVGTVARVLADATHRQVSHQEPVNLALGGRTSLRELIRMIEREMGRTLKVEFLPPRPGDVPHSQADASKLRSLFPNIQATSTADGLGHTFDWFSRPSRA
jgi:UDP-glucose 4-epimerase